MKKRILIANLMLLLMLTSYLIVRGMQELSLPSEPIIHCACAVMGESGCYAFGIGNATCRNDWNCWSGQHNCF